MSTGTMIKSLREVSLLSQNSLAEKLCITRQEISRWENDETIPDPDLLLNLSHILE